MSQLGEQRIYIAGDTGCTSEMRALKTIDIAFVPMNLPYTMPPSESAECVKAFKPKVVYPNHYRGQNTEEFKAALAGEPIEGRLVIRINKNRDVRTAIVATLSRLRVRLR